MGIMGNEKKLLPGVDWLATGFHPFNYSTSVKQQNTERIRPLQYYPLDTGQTL